MSNPSNAHPIRNRHVLFCNGAQPSGKRPVVDAETHSLRTFGHGANVRLKACHITDAMSSNLPEEAMDLLELAALVYAADQCCGRTPGRNYEYGLKWRRDFRFRVAVRRPDFWNRTDVHDALWQMLCFLSEDDYTLDFVPIQEPPFVQEYMEFRHTDSKAGRVDQVMLMSGGLDSLAGAVDQVLHHHRKVGMVSHCPVEHLGTRQHDLVTEIGRRAGGGALQPIHVPVTVNKIGLREADHTQRSRSFLYATLGACVAQLFGLDAVWFYENGVTSVNLPLCAQEVGGRATRTTHPQALHGMHKLFSLVFDRPMKVENGLFWHTKQDVLELLLERLQSDLGATSVSCAHTRQVSNPSPHCGMCSQCLARRIAALGACFGDGDPAAGYRADPLLDARDKDEERILAERFVGHARLVAGMDSAAVFHARYAGELARVLPFLNMSTDTAVDRLYDLHQKHARQVNAALESEAKDKVQLFWRQQLNDTSALSYAFGAATRVRLSNDAEADATARPTGVYPPNKIVWGGREFHCELTRQEIKVLRPMLEHSELDIAALMYKDKSAAWNHRYSSNEKVRNRINQTLSRLNNKLSEARVPFLLSLRRGDRWIDRDDHGVLESSCPQAATESTPKPASTKTLVVGRIVTES